MYINASRVVRDHLSSKARLSVSKPCCILEMPLIRGHPSNKAIFSIPHGWSYRRGSPYKEISMERAPESSMK